jgi:hypothetical protein
MPLRGLMDASVDVGLEGRCHKRCLRRDRLAVRLMLTN